MKKTMFEKMVDTARNVISSVEGLEISVKMGRNGEFSIKGDFDALLKSCLDIAVVDYENKYDDMENDVIGKASMYKPWDGITFHPYNIDFALFPFPMIVKKNGDEIGKLVANRDDESHHIYYKDNSGFTSIMPMGSNEFANLENRRGLEDEMAESIWNDVKLFTDRKSKRN